MHAAFCFAAGWRVAAADARASGARAGRCGVRSRAAPCHRLASEILGLRHCLTDCFSTGAPLVSYRTVRSHSSGTLRCSAVCCVRLALEPAPVRVGYRNHITV